LLSVVGRGEDSFKVPRARSRSSFGLVEDGPFQRRYEREESNKWRAIKRCCMIIIRRYRIMWLSHMGREDEDVMYYSFGTKKPLKSSYTSSGDRNLWITKTLIPP